MESEIVDMKVEKLPDGVSRKHVAIFRLAPVGKSRAGETFVCDNTKQNYSRYKTGVIPRWNKRFGPGMKWECTVSEDKTKLLIQRIK